MVFGEKPQATEINILSFGCYLIVEHCDPAGALPGQAEEFLRSKAVINQIFGSGGFGALLDLKIQDLLLRQVFQPSDGAVPVDRSVKGQEMQIVIRRGDPTGVTKTEVVIDVCHDQPLPEGF